MTDARAEHLRWCFESESNDPETQEWREDLTEEETAVVHKWDAQTDKGFLRICEDILSTDERLNRRVHSDDSQP